MIRVDAALFEDSPLLPTGFDFWSAMGGKGNIALADSGGIDASVERLFCENRKFLR